MKLAVHESGTGPHTAVLVHGLMSDHRAWHRVSRELVARGFRVIAVDLTGHGLSPRARRYSPDSWASDVMETVVPLISAPPELIMGHSLGALVASMVAERLSVQRLAPSAAVYVDPAFAFPGGVRGALLKVMFAVSPRPRRFALVRWNPKWSSEDVDIEVATLRHWDKRTIFGLADSRVMAPPARLVAPTLTIVADKSFLISRQVAERLRARGMTVEVIPGTGHNVFRDEPASFMDVVERWLGTAVPALRR
jgi:pimeloyl-ACP methyl ester carboxylesterase